MKRYFNIAGPCNSEKHYMIPTLSRNKEILSLIEQEQYFVIYAARQSGKTTLIQDLVSHFEKQGNYYALYCSLEAAGIFPEPEKGIPAILDIIRNAIKYSDLPDKEKFASDIRGNITTIVSESLKDYCSLLKKPLVIFFDEIDSLQDKTLIGFLRQLRDGYVNRSRIPFLHSVALVGMRNIRDYKSKVLDGRQTLGSASPFNIITEALTIKNFSKKDIADLYRQHTEATGQEFEPSATEKVYDQTDGQPWLVNGIAREIIVKLLQNDYTIPVTKELVEQAVQNIILRRDTHIDSLLERLKEERVRKVLEPILTGAADIIRYTADDTQYCLNIGLIKSVEGELMAANKIYNEVIIRELSFDSQYNLMKKVENIWTGSNKNLDMNGLLKGFQKFWRENSDIWIEKYEYKEAAPHLILQAFLQRVINAGGTVLREYASGRERIDLCVIYGKNKYVIELKLFNKSGDIEKGIKQISAYMDRMGEVTGWLVVFDRKSEKPWDEKLYWDTIKEGNRTIHIVGA